MSKYADGYSYWVVGGATRMKYAPKGLGTLLYRIGWGLARGWDAFKGPVVLIMTGWYNYKETWGECSPQTRDRKSQKFMKGHYNEPY